MSVEVERVVPYSGNGEDKGTQVRRMFNRIAGRYDLLNSMLSLGFDRGWRRKTVDSLRARATWHCCSVGVSRRRLAL